MTCSSTCGAVAMIEIFSRLSLEELLASSSTTGCSCRQQYSSSASSLSLCSAAMRSAALETAETMLLQTLNKKETMLLIQLPLASSHASLIGASSGSMKSVSSAWNHSKMTIWSHHYPVISATTSIASASKNGVRITTHARYAKQSSTNKCWKRLCSDVRQ